MLASSISYMGVGGMWLNPGSIQIYNITEQHNDATEQHNDIEFVSIIF